MSDVLGFLSAGLAPALVWGVVPRILGALYVIAFASLYPQVLGLLGSRGVAPVGQQLAAVRAHYPGVARFFRNPTLLWLSSSDHVLRALPLLGMAAGALVVVGGPFGFWALLLAFVCHLSLDMCALMFPWDCLLFEAGFLALFLPTVPTLPGVAASALPLPIVAFAFRVLLIRLMWGFAKLKFVRTQKGDDLYLRGFLAWMPMCNPLGWLMQHAPDWALRAGYWFMWLAEVVCPGLGFFRGLPRALSGLGLMALMAGIWATGNWGFFNLGYGALCIVLLDTQSSIFDTTGAMVLASPANLLLHGVLAVHLLGALVYFPLNSWISQTWLHWPWDDLTYKRPWLAALFGFFRKLSPFRVLNGYGVFPPNSSPPLKISPVFEGSDDGVHYASYGYKFMPTLAESRPPIVAPHHPRIDYLSIYAGAGMTDGDWLASLIGAGKPFSFAPFSHFTWPQRLAQRLLEGEPSVLGLLGHNPFPERPPKFVRVTLRALTPTSLAERRATGNYWRTRHVADAFAPVQHDPLVFDHWLSPPELFHPDLVTWRRKSPALSAMLQLFASGVPHEEAVRAHSDLTDEEVALFWLELIPRVAATRGDFAQAFVTAHEVRARFGRTTCLHLERLAERYVYLLRVRLEPHFYGDAKPSIARRSNFRFHLLLHELILDGRAAYEAVLAEPALAAARGAAQTQVTELHFATVMRPEIMRYHVETLRLGYMQSAVGNLSVPGLLEFAALIAAQAPAGDGWLPECTRTESGVWTVGDFGSPGLAPSPPGLAPTADSVKSLPSGSTQ